MVPRGGKQDMNQNEPEKRTAAEAVRGFLSVVVGKKLGLKLESTKRDDGQRTYTGLARINHKTTAILKSTANSSLPA
jgi:hypothetical protein